jgi:hypothetical protein
MKLQVVVKLITISIFSSPFAGERRGDRLRECSCDNAGSRGRRSASGRPAG